MGPSYIGGNMQKTVLLAVLLALVLSGCAPQGKEIILTVLESMKIEKVVEMSDKK